LVARAERTSTTAAQACARHLRQHDGGRESSIASSSGPVLCNTCSKHARADDEVDADLITHPAAADRRRIAVASG